MSMMPPDALTDRRSWVKTEVMNQSLVERPKEGRKEGGRERGKLAVMIEPVSTFISPSYGLYR